MSFISKPIFRSTALLIVIFFSFNFIFSSNVNAASSIQQPSVQSAKLTADIGDLPNKLPTTRLELQDKRTEYSTRYLNPDGSFTEEI